MRASPLVAIALVAALGPFPSAAATAGSVPARSVQASTAEAGVAADRLVELQGTYSNLQSEVAVDADRLEVLSEALRTSAVEEFVHAPGGDGGVEGDDQARLGALLSADRGTTVEDYERLRGDVRRGEDELDALEVQLDEAMGDLVRAEQAAEIEAETAAEADRRAQEEAAAASAPTTPVQAEPTAGPTSAAVAPVVAGPPVPPPPPPPPPSFVCPVAGPVSFINDWGMARSGGRAHQGTDMMSPRGTPVVANVSGTVRGSSNSVGGTSYHLDGDDGNTYYGTHLNGLAGVSGRVAVGTVVGWVGNSGNARGGPTHLHFEIHPGGGRAVNPYGTLTRYC